MERPSPEPGFDLVEAAAARKRRVAVLGRQSGPVIIEWQGETKARRPPSSRRPRRARATCPFAGIVEEIARHLLEVLLLAAEAQAR